MTIIINGNIHEIIIRDIELIRTCLHVCSYELVQGLRYTACYVGPEVPSLNLFTSPYCLPDIQFQCLSFKCGQDQDLVCQVCICL